LKARRTKLWLLDGSHPLRHAVPNGFVDYPVRSRPDGRVFFFNFELARAMGLLPCDHPDNLDRALSREILDCFGIEIINEYERSKHPAVLAADDGRRYMATRYLQLQHPDKRGLGSGDGRSIWNGCIRGDDGTWDVSSCGTGATRLSPATAITHRFYQNGDPRVSYGCGRLDLWDAVCAALMSEVLHYNGVRTERTLAIIRYPDGSAVTVRAYRNLLRPAHLFYHLKQADHAGLKHAVDYHVERQITNGDWPFIRGADARYAYLLERAIDDFARAAAQFESEYIFCWMEWDGDNILMDGGIIDYGSVRQFGLFHHEYRYDDAGRFSTRLTEQRRKARYIVQTFAQLTSYLTTGRKTPIESFRHAPALREFDERFERYMAEFLTYKIGFDPRLIPALLEDARFARDLREFRRVFSSFERAVSRHGPRKVSDGITRDAVFCMRDVLRELPTRYSHGERPLRAEALIGLMRSSYASASDVRLTRSRIGKAGIFQDRYWRMIERASVIANQSPQEILRDLSQRTALINRRERITGDGILIAARKMIRDSYSVNHKELYEVFQKFVADQILRPEARQRESPVARSRPSRLLYESLRQIIADHREGL
jgi:uncharacterized protein YdiU (UPF0061 family)